MSSRWEVELDIASAHVIQTTPEPLPEHFIRSYSARDHERLDCLSLFLRGKIHSNLAL